MRKSSTGARRRLLTAGLTTSAVIAALLIAPQAAHAAVPVLSPTMGPVGTTVTATYTSFTGDTLGVIFTTNATCPDNYTTTISGQTATAATGITKAAGTVTTASFVVPTVALTAVTGAAKVYLVCMYQGTSASSARAGDAAGVNFTVTPTVTVSPTTGVSGGGNTITATLPTTSPVFAATPGVRFISGAGCPVAYNTANAAAVNASTVTKTSTTVASISVPAGVLGTGATTPYTACFYADNSTGALIAATAAAYNVTLPAATPATNVGPASGGNGITATFASNVLTNVTTMGALFTTADRCPTTYKTSPVNYAAGPPITHAVVQAAAGSVRKLANNRAAVTVPTLSLVGGNTTAFQVCFYNGTTNDASPIVASTAYTAMVVPTPTSVTPNSGSALGGETITVFGTNFPITTGAITATLGGEPLTNITPINDQAFTAVTPPHVVAAGVPLVVTTTAGTKVLQAAYSYTNAIQVTPNTAPNTLPNVDVSVKGVGFLSELFNGVPANAHVYLVNGAYSAGPSVYNAARKANGPVAECGNVLVLTDTELICSLQLNRRLHEMGSIVDPASYVNILAADVTTVSGTKVITSASGGFSMADVGQMIIDQTQANIAAATTITAVLNPNKALISVNASGSASGVTVYIGGVQSGTVTTSNGSPTGVITTFGAAELNRVIAGKGIPAGTAISGQTAGVDITLSANATTGLGAGAGVATLLGNNVAAVTTSSNSTTVTAATKSFALSDVGRHIFGTGIPVGTTITGVSGGGTTATLSLPATAPGTVSVIVGGTQAKTVTIGTTNTDANITAPAMSFSLADVGRPITGTNIPPSTVINSVAANGAGAVLSNPASGSGSVTATVAGTASAGSALSVNATANDANITGSVNTFAAADIGKTVTGPGIPVGATITAVTANGNGATLSLPATHTGAGITVNTFTAMPVPVGAYTLTYVTNGLLDAAALDPQGYSQSAVSSGSTFTVASF